MVSLTIRLGEKDYQVPQLTIGQLRDLHIGVSQEVRSGADGVADLWTRNIHILSTALSTDYPDITPEALSKLRVKSTDEIVTAVNDVLRFSGLVKSDSPPGEARAEAI